MQRSREEYLCPLVQGGRGGLLFVLPSYWGYDGGLCQKPASRFLVRLTILPNFLQDWRSAVIRARVRAGAEHPPGDVAPEPSWLEKLRGQQIKISISFLILIFFGWVLDFSVQNLVCDRPSTRATWE